MTEPHFIGYPFGTSKKKTVISSDTAKRKAPFMERGQSLPKQALLRQQHPDFTGAVEVPRDIGRPRALPAEHYRASAALPYRCRLADSHDQNGSYPL